MSENFQVVYPAVTTTSNVKAVSPSLPDLNGKVIGELWNWAFRGDEPSP